jgi:hypothetical protein
MRRRWSSVLTDLAAELGEVAEAAEVLQTLIDPTVLNAGPRPGDELAPELAVALQSLDHASQSLRCLLQFVVAVADQPAAVAEVEIGAALEPIWLSRLQRRLGGAEPGAGSVESAELFDVT